MSPPRVLPLPLPPGGLVSAGAPPGGRKRQPCSRCSRWTPPSSTATWSTCGPTSSRGRGFTSPPAPSQVSPPVRQSASKQATQFRPLFLGSGPVPMLLLLPCENVFMVGARAGFPMYVALLLPCENVFLVGARTGRSPHLTFCALCLAGHSGLWLAPPAVCWLFFR